MSDNLNDLFNEDSAASALSFLNPKKTQEGVYRPDLSKTKDGKAYKAKIRFLPNLLSDGLVMGQNGISKRITRVEIPTHPELNGYYDNQQGVNGQKNCPMTQLFFFLKKHRDVDMQAKSEYVKSSLKYYSYVYVIEDQNQPEFEGKILVYPYGIKIAEKIKNEAEGLTGDPCNVFSLANGKDFNLIITNVAKQISYDNSFFDRETSVIRVDGKEFPTEKNERGVINIKSTFREKMKQFLLDRKAELDDFAAKPWTDEQWENFEKIRAILSEEEEVPVKSVKQAVKAPVAANAMSAAKPSNKSSIWEDDDELGDSSASDSSSIDDWD